jgi:tyrosyl-DNA phosphodiesterase-1
MKEFLPVVLPKGRMAEKLKNSAPYNIFLTTVTDSPKTHIDPLSVTFLELLDPSLGELESSVQFNFMVDIAWLMAQYTFGRARHLPLLILYGSDMEGIADINKKIPNVNSVKVQIATPFGCHHTKMMIFFYKDGSMRVVVSTANLYEDDWNNRVQGLWISDNLPALPEGVSHANNGESVTNFRADLLSYLHAYNIPKLQPIISRVRSTDFSSVKVFFVASVPGTYNDLRGYSSYGHPKVAKLLSEQSAPIDDACPIIVQASSIGSLGAQPHVYLLGEIAQSFRKDSAPVGIRRQPTVKLIYPSLNNVLNSHDKMQGGGCLPYDGEDKTKLVFFF